MRKVYLLWFLMSACWNATAQHDCESAIALPSTGGRQSVNYVKGTTDYWYSYTAGENVVVTLMYCGTGSVSMSAQLSCDGSPAVYGNLYCDPAAYTGRGMQIQVKQDETYYIRITAYTAFDGFDVTVAPIRLGGGNLRQCAAPDRRRNLPAGKHVGVYGRYMGSLHPCADRSPYRQFSYFVLSAVGYQA